MSSSCHLNSFSFYPEKICYFSRSSSLCVYLSFVHRCVVSHLDSEPEEEDWESLQLVLSLYQIIQPIVVQSLVEDPPLYKEEEPSV